MAKMTAKDRHRIKLLEFLGNPENDFVNRESMPSVLKISKATFRQHFSPQDLEELEREALELRRKKYAPGIAKADRALFIKAETGDTAAIKLIYQRFEGMSEKMEQKHSGEVNVNHTHAIKLQVMQELLGLLDGGTKGIKEGGEGGQE